jgi:hypothetical protein
MAVVLSMIATILISIGMYPDGKSGSMELRIRSIILFLISGIFLYSCLPTTPPASLTVNLDDIEGLYFFDGSCFPDTFDLQATLVGDAGRVSAVIYSLTITGPGGTHIEIVNNLFADHIRDGYYSRLVGMADELRDVTEDELTGELSVRAVDSSGVVLGHAERTLTFQRCAPDQAMTIRPDVSTRDLYYGTSCTSSVTHTVIISRSTPLPAGVHMTAYWLAEDAAGNTADFAAHPMIMRDLTTPDSLYFYEFTDTLTLTDEVVHEVESLLGTLDLTNDPIFMVHAVYEINGRENVQRLWNTEGITIAVHPCLALPAPTVTTTPTETPSPTLVPHIPPTKKTGNGESGGGAGACSSYSGKDACSAAGCSWDPDKKACN